MWVQIDFCQIRACSSMVYGTITGPGESKDPGNGRIRSSPFQRMSGRPQRIILKKVREVYTQADFAIFMKIPRFFYQISSLSGRVCSSIVQLLKFVSRFCVFFSYVRIASRDLYNYISAILILSNAVKSGFFILLCFSDFFKGFFTRCGLKYQAILCSNTVVTPFWTQFESTASEKSLKKLRKT